MEKKFTQRLKSIPRTRPDAFSQSRQSAFLNLLLPPPQDKTEKMVTDGSFAEVVKNANIYNLPSIIEETNKCLVCFTALSGDTKTRIFCGAETQPRLFCPKCKLYMPADYYAFMRYVEGEYSSILENLNVTHNSLIAKLEIPLKARDKNITEKQKEKREQYDIQCIKAIMDSNYADYHIYDLLLLAHFHFSYTPIDTSYSKKLSMAFLNVNLDIFKRMLKLLWDHRKYVLDFKKVHFVNFNVASHQVILDRIAKLL